MNVDDIINGVRFGSSMGGTQQQKTPERVVTNEDGDEFVACMERPSQSMLDLNQTLFDELKKKCDEKGLICRVENFRDEPNSVYFLIALDNYEYNRFKLTNDGYSASWSRVQ